ncbi:hypothetical protein BX666DRAFT_759020 [Dichotomocladium elegans]|nr:hypothetical protein BX666DRAFT_759020 [Dichotomocladium elegans]
MPNVNAEDILHAVQTNRQTLKSITLPIPGGGRATRTALFEFLLTGCPRLQRLVCGFYGLRDVSWWLDRDEGWHGPGGMASPIVELGLLDMARLQTYALDRVLAVCPNLRRLHLIGASSSAINSILEICHNLRILSFNLPFEVEYPMPPYEDDHGQGLQVLNLCHDAVFRSDERLSQAVGSIFDRYHNTIREIVLHGMRRSFKLNHLCRGLEHAHSHSLRRLHLALSSFDEKTIGAMISRFPNLEDVTAKLNFLADSTICTSLGQLSKLRSLTLRHCPRNSLEEEVAEEDDCAIHLGNLFCNLRNRNTLNTLCLHTMPFETRVCLKYLQGICLEKLVMWELAFPASTEEMHGFLNSSLTVRHLELHNTLCITDALCKQIRTIRGLQEIYIRYLYNVGDAGFLALTATDDLRWIKVRNCRHISQTAIDKASGLIPIFTSHAE